MEQFFFWRGDARLLGMHYAAQGPCRGRIVLCDPLYQDSNWAARHLWHLGAELARAGYHVLRFNWFGFGDSDGDEEEITFETLLGDVGAALEELSRRSPEGPTILAGLRGGSYVAALGAERYAEQLHGLMLWEPVAHFGQYLETELRATVTTQTALFGRVVRTRQDILSNIEQGRPDENVVEGLDWGNLEGFRLSTALVCQRTSADLTGRLGAFVKPVLLCAIRSRPKARLSPAVTGLAAAYEQVGCPVEVAHVEEIAFWKNNARYTQRAPALTKRTLQWLAESIPSW